ncbi:MAG TPA: PucR family transcriptional regulator [Leifsonia sp.]|jgi:purine catabolism regulator|uniref:PucR family transcriptional regulator n=1 Tax=Mycetocola sp. TaxID=1871042 RepID=UPI0026283F7A|nr:PucR family transcriptional regulator [Mycetocola sp.]MCU1419158.1 hypothetical protein [Mycetocola sp.]MCU1559776.1 hypothetical protein [Mycetocola sp.]HEV7813213.1 PucR family transcriptional regulator [Leifsonia sp.]
MPLTVSALLALPVLAHARPEVVSGEQLDRRVVRWVHSSEIYEISSLLQGGEVLLTTGLGLVALSPDVRRAYIADLARVGIAALLLELGRTFPVAPDDLVEEARRVGLPLVLLHGVVPFIEVTQVAHALLLGSDLDDLRLSASVTERMLHALGERAGLVGLTGIVGEQAGCPVALYTADGELAAGIALDGSDAVASVRAPVVAGGVVWGELVLDAPATGRLRTIATSAAQVLAAEVARSGATPVSRNQAGAELLRDLVTGRYGSTAELTSRALGTGMAVRPGQKVLALCVRPRTATAAANTVLIAARGAARRVFAGSITAEHDGDVLVAAVVAPRELRTAVARFADEVEAELRSTTGGSVLVSAGHAVDDVPALVSAFPSARETARLAMRLTPAARVVVAADFALYQLLASLVDDEALERFVNDQLGVLLTHDARTGAGLVMTLDAYLAAGLSKTRTAEALGIRRQTLYGRLERISRLLGGLDLDNRERRTALDLALVSWRLRVSAAVRQ